MIDILDRPTLFDTLNKLQPGHKPVFGAMTPQHMVEHLAFTVACSNGKFPQHHYYSTEKQQKIRAFVIDSDKEFPIGFKSPILPVDELPVLQQLSLKDAIENLKSELVDFDDFFLTYPFEKPINPTMGELNHQEWVRFHNRHFTHHFRQFKLV